jgi:RNA:NAD 2'-phosphotransferase (TPT1/KptA family)
MFAAGYEFFLSHNGDILTERIPGKFVKMMKGV